MNRYKPQLSVISHAAANLPNAHFSKKTSIVGNEGFSPKIVGNTGFLSLPNAPSIFMKNSTFPKLKPRVRFNFQKNEGFSVNFTERIWRAKGVLLFSPFSRGSRTFLSPLLPSDRLQGQPPH